MTEITITSDSLLSIDDARSVLNVSRMQMWRWTKAGLLRPLYFGNRPYYTITEIQEFKAQREGSGKETVD